jgi:hypothetical protein
MSRSEPPLSPEARALLDREREAPPLPPAVKARALARARAALVAGPVRAAASPTRAPRVRWAAAVALTCVAGAAVGAVAYQVRAHLEPSPSAPPAPLIVAAPAHALAPPSAPEQIPEVRSPPRVLPTPRLARADQARAELHLLRRARAAVAGGDFAAALAPIAEHAHRFKDGRLAEEREALRVKALAGLGRTEEARRAAAAFEARFPRSVLLPAVSQMPTSGP